MNLLRFILLQLTRLYIKCKYRIKMQNPQLIPRNRKPLLFISNHPSLLDTVIYKCALKQDFYVCGAKENYFSTASKRWIMKLARIIKVTGEENFLRDCSDLLSRRRHILIYPEMGRRPELGSFLNWGARVAKQSGVTVVPMRIYGTTSTPVRDIEIRVGEAFTSPENMDYTELNELFFKKIKDL
jgi:1-acyl-sn-glycerol-3-phosphate acyltransferase